MDLILKKESISHILMHISTTILTPESFGCWEELLFKIIKKVKYV